MTDDARSPDGEKPIADPLKLLALGYAPGSVRPLQRWLFGFDQRMAEALERTSEPIMAQLRLAWWRDALNAAPSDRPRGERLLNALAEIEAGGLVKGPDLVTIVDGWEQLVGDSHWERAQVDAHARERGEGLFRLVAKGAGVDVPQGLDAAGRGWAAWDLARHAANKGTRELAFSYSVGQLHEVRLSGWPRELRGLAVLTRAALFDVAAGRPDAVLSIRGWLRLVTQGLTGR